MKPITNLRFPGELRASGFSSLAQDSWMTYLLFPLYQIAGPRSPLKNQTATPGKTFQLLFYRYMERKCLKV